MVPDHGRDYHELFALADKMLYKVKQSGKHDCAIYTASEDDFQDDKKETDLKDELMRITQIVEGRNDAGGALVLAGSPTEITPSNTSGTMTITLTIAAASVKTAPTANTLTYSGSAQVLATAGEAENGTMQYCLGTNGTTAPTNGFAAEIPTGTDAKNAGSR